MNTTNNLNKMLVSLDLTEIDAEMIQYAAFFSQILDSERVCFVHAIQAYDLPGKAGKKIPEMHTSIRETIEAGIDRVVTSHFKKNTQTEIIIQTEEEDAARGVLEIIKKRKIGLTLIGQKYGTDREGRYGKKIALSAPSDVMFIPEKPPVSAKNIFCAVDFSGDSESAFRKALKISRVTGGSLTCFYIFDASKSYFPATTTQTSASIKKNTEKKFKKFLQKFGLSPSSINGVIDINDRLTAQAKKLYSKAEETDADLIIIGAKGQTSSITSLLGNVTESLRRMEKDIPVWIVKNPKNKKNWLNL